MLALDVSEWAAIVIDAGQSADFGMVAPAAEIPAQLRRRMPAFARETVRCSLNLARGAPASEIIFSSRYGDLSSNVELLGDLASETLLSPARFSVSVHNAPPGLIGQCVGASASHTAIAGEGATLMAGLTEAYARLVTQEAQSVLIVHADVALPPIYGEFEEDAAGVVVALHVRSARAEPEAAASSDTEVDLPGVEAQPDRAGLVRLVAQLDAGARCLRFLPPAVTREQST